MIKGWVCPRCGKKTIDYPAISRVDNETEICSQCGIDEALEEYFGASTKESHDNPIDQTPSETL